MLVLTRYPNQTIVIGNDFAHLENNVEVTILSIQGEQVRLGINAPREVTVHREEIFNRIKAEKLQDVTVVN